VTKYWDLEETKEFISEFSPEDLDILAWFWENRLSSLKEKNLDREQTHFIGNIQTKEIKHITKYCDTIHSVDNIKHVKKMEEICEKQNTWVKIFLQINIDSSKEWWIKSGEIPKFMELIDKSDNISLIWFSAIGLGEFTKKEKIEEFKFLKDLRNKYIPHWLISAGTSRDYEIALEEGIDIIRVWKNLII
jgi:uncharacterized pyridoxal phosphate-containing UPF0001 family protein